METTLKLGDQIYRSVFAWNRRVSEVIGFIIIAILFHVLISVFAERAKTENAPSLPKNVNTTTGNQSPIVSDPQGAVTIHQESGK